MSTESPLPDRDGEVSGMVHQKWAGPVKDILRHFYETLSKIFIQSLVGVL